MLFCLSFASLDAHEGEAKQAGGMWQTGFRICETNKLELRGGYYVTHFLKHKEISTNRHKIITKKKCYQKQTHSQPAMKETMLNKIYDASVALKLFLLST